MSTDLFCVKTTFACHSSKMKYINRQPTFCDAKLLLTPGVCSETSTGLLVWLTQPHQDQQGSYLLWLTYAQQHLSLFPPSWQLHPALYKQDSAKCHRREYSEVWTCFFVLGYFILVIDSRLSICRR